MSAFENAYIERCNKETETMIATESNDFLEQTITYLKEHKNEFIYMESNIFEEIGVEGLSLEMDDVFGTYDVMLGLKLQKKFEKPLKEHLNAHLHGDEAKFDLMFSHEDGLWDLNFTLNYVDGFSDEISLSGAFEIIYRFLSKLVADVKA
ncbi:branched-chain amino acid aminotransferase [Neobacillus sp. K501]